MAAQQHDAKDMIEGPGLIESLRQYWLLAATVVVVFAVAGLGLSLSSSATYVSTAKIGLSDPASNSSPAGLSRYTALVAQSVKSDDVLKPAAAKLANTSPSNLRGVVSATSDPDSNVVYITAAAASQQLAADRANAVLSVLKDTVGTKAEVKREAFRKSLVDRRTAAEELITKPGNRSAALIQNAQQTLTFIAQQEIAVANEAAQFGDGVSFVTLGLVPAKAGLKDAALQGIIGGLVGAILATIGCWIIADRRRQIGDASIPAVVTGARLLGEVPTLRGGAARSLTNFADMPAPSFEFAAAGLWSSLEDGVFMVSGAEHGAGSSTTVANLAAAFARDGRRVVVVDADGLDRTITRIAGIAEGSAGLSDVLTHRSPLEDALRAVDLGDATSVAVLPAGRPEADLASLLRTSVMSETLERLREWYDLIIIDTPPLTTSAEGASLARSVDGVLFVVGRGTRLRRVERLRDRLALLQVPLLGYVFNRDQAIDVAVGRVHTSKH